MLICLESNTAQPVLLCKKLQCFLSQVRSLAHYLEQIEGYTQGEDMQIKLSLSLQHYIFLSSYIIIAPRTSYSFAVEMIMQVFETVIFLFVSRSLDI